MAWEYLLSIDRRLAYQLYRLATTPGEGPNGKPKTNWHLLRMAWESIKRHPKDQYRAALQEYVRLSLRTGAVFAPRRPGPVEDADPFAITAACCWAADHPRNREKPKRRRRF